MKKCLSLILLFAVSIGLQAADVKVEIREMTKGATGNQRLPMIAENAQGERIYTYRANDRYAHYFLYKNGTWQHGGRIPGSPLFEEYWYSDIVVDSTGTFHFVCEDMDKAMYYSYFQDGAWAPMSKIDVRHEATLALGVKSDDTIVLVSAMRAVGVGGLTKDVILGTKAKGEKNFSHFKNITHDKESSAMVDVAIDSKDNVWIAYKGAYLKGGGETLQATLLGLDKSYEQFYFKNVSGQEGAWCWYPRVAVNSDGLIMVTWMTSQLQSYFYRLYDPAKDKWTEVKPLISGPMTPWCTMYNKILARGSDFFWVGLGGDRYVRLYKYNAEKDIWSKLANVSTAGAYWCSAANGADSILVSWDSLAEPVSCFLTTVTGKLIGTRFSKISGTVKQGTKGVSGVTLTVTGLPENPTTDSLGNYSMAVNPGWTGTVKPYKSGYRFVPESRVYSNVTSDQTAQNYSAIAQFNLTISATSGGTTTPPPATYPKDLNSSVTVTAIPGQNYRFANWTGTVSGSGNPITLKIDKNITIRANFIRIKSVANLQWEQRVERGFFSGYTLNALTWTANPENAAMGLTVSAQRVYRKARTEDNSKWVRIADLAGTVLNYEDRKVAKDSDFVYAVTCVDDKGNESPVY